MTGHKLKDDVLLEFLLSLAAAGPLGFEGLVRNLLETWTGETFRLARSGSQHGKDAVSSDANANCIAAEMKKYDPSHPLSDADISSKLQQVAEALPELDIWILATTRELGEIEERNLRQRAETFGIEAIALDARVEGVGPLQAFCARFPDTVTAFCRDVTPFSEEALRARLKEISLHPGFQVQSSALSLRLQRATIGFDSTRKRASDWLSRKLQSTQESMATFFQDVGLRDEGRSTPLHREQISGQLQSWWNGGNHHEWRCALLGEEGVGKTWAAMAWLLKLSQQPNAPIIMPVTSGQMPHVTDLSEIVVRTLHKRFGRSELFWSRRIERWEPARLGFPPLLLFLDGLNESPKVQWRLLLEQTNSDYYRGKIALLATCRPVYWQKLYITLPCNTIQTEGYDDQELKRILSLAERHLQEVPQALRPLIRRPRYCELVLTHFEKMAEDPTIERLLYEDYRNRMEKKANYPISPDDFSQILTALAEQYREGVTHFRRHEISNLVAGASEVDSALQEIMDGGLFVESGTISPSLKVDRRRLIHGLGMLLADHLADAGEKTRSEHLESIGRWLEPGAEMDIKSPIVGAAIFFATINPSYPSHARQALLEYWLSRRNVADTEEDILTAYLPECPEDVLAVADSFWEERNMNEIAEERLTWSIIYRRDHPKVKPALIRAAIRWMSYVNIGGYPSREDIHGDARAKHIAAIEKKLGRKIQAGDSIDFGRWTFNVIDDDRKLFLSRLALKVICAGDRLTFLEALFCWAVSRSIMERFLEGEDVAWALRLTDEPLWETLRGDLEVMAKSDDDVLRKAANGLLWCLGTREAHEMKKRLLHGLYPKQEWEIEYEQDPCKSPFSIGREHYQECLSREDISMEQALWKLNTFLPDPDLAASPEFLNRLSEESRNLPLQTYNLHQMGNTIEDCNIDRFIDVAARFYPTLTGDIFRSIIQNLPSRDPEQQAWFLKLLPKICILLRKKELQILRKTLSAIRSAIAEGALKNDLKHSESAGTLALHYHMPPDRVVDDILDRHKDAIDVNMFDQCQQISPEAGQHLLNSLLSPPDTKYLQRLLRLLPLISSDLLTTDNENRLLELLSGKDVDMQCGALRYAYYSNNETLIEQVIHEKLSIPATASRTHAYEAAIIVAHGTTLPFETLLRRLSLYYTLRAIKKRGYVLEEIRLITNIIDAVICSVTLDFVPDTNMLIEQTAQKYKHELHSIRIEPDVMAAMYEADQNVVTNWAKIAIDDPTSYIHVFSGLLYSLCEVMLARDSDYGVKLWRRLKSARGSVIDASSVDWLAYMAFTALPQDAGRIACEELLLTANSDVELYLMVLAAQKYGQNSWILEKAELLLRSPHLWQRGKGLMLLALSDDCPKAFDEVIKTADVEDTWLEKPVLRMKYISDRNEWGKHWYRLFLTAEEEDDAFCAWHMFLKCIDSRSWNWMGVFEKEFSLPESKALKRIPFRAMNKSLVERAIGEKEKEYAELFFTIKIRSSKWEHISPYCMPLV